MQSAILTEIHKLNQLNIQLIARLSKRTSQPFKRHSRLLTPNPLNQNQTLILLQAQNKSLSLMLQSAVQTPKTIKDDQYKLHLYNHKEDISLRTLIPPELKSHPEENILEGFDRINKQINVVKKNIGKLISRQIQALQKNDPAGLEEVSPLFQKMRSAYQQISMAYQQLSIKLQSRSLLTPLCQNCNRLSSNRHSLLLDQPDFSIIQVYKSNTHKNQSLHHVSQKAFDISVKSLLRYINSLHQKLADRSLQKDVSQHSVSRRPQLSPSQQTSVIECRLALKKAREMRKRVSQDKSLDDFFCKMR